MKNEIIRLNRLNHWNDTITKPSNENNDTKSSLSHHEKSILLVNYQAEKNQSDSELLTIWRHCMILKLLFCLKLVVKTLVDFDAVACRIANSGARYFDLLIDILDSFI